MGIKAKLTTFDTTMIVVSLVIGIGIFRTPAIVGCLSSRFGPRRVFSPRLRRPGLAGADRAGVRSGISRPGR